MSLQDEEPFKAFTKMAKTLPKEPEPKIPTAQLEAFKDQFVDLSQVTKDYFRNQDINDVVKAHDIGYLSKTLEDPNFGKFAGSAYDSELGYAIRINPVTGDKEMFVAGTRDNHQWALNAWDGVVKIAGKSVKGHDKWRRHSKELYEAVAKENGVDVIYGHSRGGAILADMNVPGVAKIGLDSAMVIADNHDLWNINQGGTGKLLSQFDAALGMRGKNNTAWDSEPFSPHYVYAKPKKSKGEMILDFLLPQLKPKKRKAHKSKLAAMKKYGLR